MQKKPTNIILIIIFILSISSLLSAKQNVDTIFGTYQSLGNLSRDLTIHFHPDKTAIIDISKKTKGSYEWHEKEEERYYATWSFDGLDVKITYNRKTEFLRFHESLSFKEFGIKGGVPGLKVPNQNQNSGIIGSVSLWKSEDLKKLSRLSKFRFQLEGIKLTDSDYDIPILYVLAPGLFIFMIGIFLTIKKLIFLRRAHHVLGEVISLSARLPVADYAVLAQFLPKRMLPKIRFIAESGTPYEFVDNITSGWLSVQVGSKIAVVYNPKNPRKAFIKNYITIWSHPFLISAFGILLIYLFL